jgi:hypothetical protein
MMTAAMAFFSIALTINLTGVKLTEFHVADLKPSSIRAYMERQFTMASSPIIRYYDHLRLVYEVQTRMRELRKTPDGDSDQAPAKADPTPGESRQNPSQPPARKDGGSSYDPPQQSIGPSVPDERDLDGTTQTKNERPAHPGGSRAAREERS